MDRPTVQAWLDRYSRAWETYDPAEIGELFAAEATYRYHPWDEGSAVMHGRDSIVKSWVAPDGVASGHDAEGTYEGFPMAILVNRYSASASEIFAACMQDHQRAVVVGVREG